MNDGIQSISMIPPANGGISVDREVAALIQNSKCFRAAIAFWTLSPESLGTIIGFDPIPILKKAGSFLCCDLQWPTNIDNLAKYASAGVDVYLNLRRLAPAYEKLSNSPGLLHCKVILTDRADDYADLWVGSHNWTDFALKGPNTEASLAIRLANSASLYSEIETFLEEVKYGLCSRFDLGKVDYYKELQNRLFEREKRLSSVIELEGKDIYSLSGEVINVFGTNREDFESLRRVGGDVHLSVYDSTCPNDPDAKALYKAEILQAGVLDRMNPAASGVEINARRRYAFDNRKNFPVLEPLAQISPSILRDAYFFVTIEISRAMHDDYYVSEPSDQKTPLWAPSTEDLSFYKMDRGLSCSPYLEDALILVPRDDDRANPQFRAEIKSSELRYSLEERRVYEEVREKRIVRKMVVRKRY